MLNTKVAMPGVHMAGSNTDYDAHLEVGQHGFGVFLSPDAEYPVLDVNGTSEQLDAFVQALQAALLTRRLNSGLAQDAPINLTRPLP